MADRLYVLKDGFVVTDIGICTSYHILTGKPLELNSDTYNYFVNALMGVTIDHEIDIDNTPIAEIAEVSRINAIMIYRRKNKCDLKTAISVIDHLLGRDEDDI